MDRAGDEFAPGVAVQQAKEGTLMDGGLDRRFKRLLDFCGRSDFTRCHPREKGLQEGPLLLQGQLLLATPARPRGFDGHTAEAGRGGNHPAHRAEGDPGLGRNLLGLARGHEGLVVG